MAPSSSTRRPEPRPALYARVSTDAQTTENQLRELRRYAAVRGWSDPVEYVDSGVSGIRDRRPALEALVKDAHRRRFNVLVVWKLDRLGRSLKHLILLLEELSALGVDFVSLGSPLTPPRPPAGLKGHPNREVSDGEIASRQGAV